MTLPRPPAQRRRELTIGPIAPWHATIAVDAVTTNHGRRSSLPTDYLFEVAAEWHGPPAIGFPPSASPVDARDVVVVTTLAEARELAHRAAEAFAAGGAQAPDLRDHLRRNSVAFAPRLDPDVI